MAAETEVPVDAVTNENWRKYVNCDVLPLSFFTQVAEKDPDTAQVCLGCRAVDQCLKFQNDEPEAFIAGGVRASALV